MYRQLVCIRLHRALAQLVERQVRNLKATGSIPVCSTMTIGYYRRLHSYNQSVNDAGINRISFTTQILREDTAMGDDAELWIESGGDPSTCVASFNKPPALQGDNSCFSLQ